MSFRSLALPEFWKRYDALPEHTRQLAHTKFALFEREPFSPSFGLEQKGGVWTIDVGPRYRAIAYRAGDEFHWFWIGPREAYNKLLGRVEW